MKINGYGSLAGLDIKYVEEMMRREQRRRELENLRKEKELLTGTEESKDMQKHM